MSVYAGQSAKSRRARPSPAQATGPRSLGATDDQHASPESMAGLAWILRSNHV